MVSLKKYWFLIAIFNSLYLSFLNLKGFFLESNLLELEKAFTIVIFTNPLILIILFYISFIKKDPSKETVFRNLLLILSLLIAILMIGAFIYNALRDKSSLYEYLAGIFVEILSISLAIDKDRTKKIQDLVGYFSLCFLTAVLSFSLIGFLEKYFYDGEINNRLIIVYTATFFHFFNACFLIWKSIINNFPNQKTSNPEV